MADTGSSMGRSAMAAKRFFSCLLLAAMSTGAIAEWVQYLETEQIVYYIDAATIRRDGNFRKVWLVQDLKQRTKYGAMSRRFLEEFDCKKERFRLLSISVHSGPMASGETLGPTLSDQWQWEYIAPSTVTAETLKLVCDK